MKDLYSKDYAIIEFLMVFTNHKNDKLIENGIGERKLMKIGLIRHGMTDWNVERRAQGQTDIPLNHVGKDQAIALANRLTGENWDLIISSHLSRAYATAKAIADKLNIPLYKDERLQERGFGLLEGTTEAERVEKWGTSWKDIDFGEESTTDVRKRSLSAIEEACLQYPNKRILFVSHGATLKQLFITLLKDETFDKGFHNTSLSIFEKQDNNWECTLLNCSVHLEQTMNK